MSTLQTRSGLPKVARPTPRLGRCLVGTLSALLSLGACTAGRAPDKNIQPTDAHAPAAPTVTYTARCKLPRNLIACTQLASDASATIQILGDQEHGSGVTVDVKSQRPVYTAILAITGTKFIAASLFEDLLLNNGWKVARRTPNSDKYIGSYGGPHADQTVALQYVKPSGPFFLVRATLTGRPIR